MKMEDGINVNKLEKYSNMLLKFFKLTPEPIKSYDYRDLIVNQEKWKTYFSQMIENLSQIERVLSHSKKDDSIAVKRKINWVLEIAQINAKLHKTTLILNNSWIPDPDLGEETTPNLKKLIKNLNYVKKKLLTLRIEMEKSVHDLKILDRAKNLSIVKDTLASNSEKGLLKKVSPKIKLKHWKELANLVSLSKNTPVILEDSVAQKKFEDALDIGFDPNKYKADKSQKLLDADNETWEIVNYTVVIQGFIPKRIVKMLNGSPFNFKAELVGGYWYLRDALLLATPRTQDDYKKVQEEISELAKKEYEWKVLDQKLSLIPDPILHKKHLYWLLVPREQEGITINSWGLAN